MALNATTLSSAITNSQTVFGVASATGITAPIFNTGVGITYLSCETEFMLVVAVSGTFVTVQRGVAGTPATSHLASTPIVAGLPADFGVIVPAVKASQDPTPNGQLYGFSQAVASSATIAAPGPLFHVTGTTAINIITPPPGMIEGTITIIFDGACTFTSSNTTNGISASTTGALVAGSAVSFYLDAQTAHWFPSRTA